ncbi:MAG: ABC transporter permease, partial [Acutalibacter sp.]|nr:ABC transporter permease [Acutalibacter sp.]
NRRVYVPFLLSSIGIIMMFYIMQSISLSVDARGLYGGQTITTMMNLGAIIIGIFAVLFLFYTNSFIMKRRKKELGLYNILGMEKFHIGKIIFRETLFTTFTAILLGIGLGILFSRAMFLLLQKILGVALHITFSVPGLAVLITVILFFAIFFVTMLYNILQVRLAKPIELLHGGEVGEKEPKAHWILAALGLILLGTGYWMALSIQDPIAALVFFFVAVILVIFGTYLLFITGITALLKILKKKKNFYYRANHFTTVSGMLYRMKQNAAGLASICILFTCLLVTVSTTFSLYTSMEDLIRTRYPRNILITARGVNQEGKEFLRETVQKACEEEGVVPLNVIDQELWGFYVGRQDNTFLAEDPEIRQSAVLRTYRLEEFNRLSGENEVLAENEVLLYDPGNRFPWDTMTVEGATYSVRKIDFDLSQAGDNVMLTDVETYGLIVPDDELPKKLAGLYVDISHIDLDNYAATFQYNFDVDGSREKISRVGDTLIRLVSEQAPEDISYERLKFENAANDYEEFVSIYGGLFFLGMFLGTLFLMGTVMIIYYKQVSEGYEDARRFSIMQKVGMSKKEVKQSIHSQIMLVFFLPLFTAVVHLGFAFPMLQKILWMMNLTNFWVIFLSSVGCVVLFGLIYAAVYAVTARTYYKIVETAAD